jgi:glycosyltransferase involved in cell wall biosynthesis
MEIVIPIIDFGRAGGHRVLSNLANEWIRLGHTVRFLCPSDSVAPYFPTTAGIIWLDQQGKRVSSNERSINPRRHRILHAQKLEALRSLLGGLRRYAKNADVVMANQSLTAWPVFLARINARKYYYVQAYEPEYYSLMSGGLRTLVLQLLSRCSYLLPLKQIVNAPIYLGYRALSAHTSVPPGIDFKLFYPKQMHDKRHTRLIIGCIGRPEVFKGTKYVYDACHILSQRGINVELRVAFGNTLDKPNSDIQIVVPKNDRELGGYYRSLDILVAPGTVQLGAPHYPVMEAMACGVTVVTTGYMPANNHNSWIVPVHDARAIADAIAEIQANPEEQLTRVAQASKDIQPFTWNAAAVSMLHEFSN